MMNNKKRGEFLRRARENKNLTQEELGRLIFYSDKTISAWEKGIYAPSDYETILKLAEVLEINPLSIIYGEENIDEEEQVFTYLKIKRQTKIHLLLLTSIFLITIIFILISFYFTNLKDTTNYYMLITNNDEYYLDDSFFIQSKNTNILSLNKIHSSNNKNYINRIDLYYIENKERVKIISGPNESYYLENNNIADEYNIKNLLHKDLYLSIYVNNNKEIKLKLFLTKKKEVFTENNIEKIQYKEFNILEEMGFKYLDGEYIYKDDNITIKYYQKGVLNLIKENKDNNEYLSKRINNDNIIYKQVFTNGKYKEKDIIINDSKKCDVHNHKNIEDLVKCLNYLSEELK